MPRLCAASDPTTSSGVAVNPAFTRLLSSQSLAMLADSTLTLALGLWARQLSGATSSAGVVFACFAVPTLLGPLLGPALDRHGPRVVMIATNATLSVAVASLVTVHDESSIGLVYVVAFAYGLGQQVYFAARNSLVPTVVSEKDLGRANGMLEALRQGLRIIGPPLGAIALSTYGPNALAISVSLALATSSLLLFPTRQERVARSGASDGALTMWAGFRVFAGDAFLTYSLLRYASAYAVAGLLEVTIFSLVSSGLDLPDSWIGYLLAVQGIGAVIGGLVSTRLPSAPAKTMKLGLAAFTLGNAALLMGQSGSSLTGMVLCGFGMTTFAVAFVTTVQERTPLQLRGRAFLAAEALGNLPFLIALGVASTVIDNIDYHVLLIAGIALSATATIAPVPAKTSNVLGG